MMNASKCIMMEYLVGFFSTTLSIPLTINNSKLKGPSKNTDKKSKFGVQGPDLNSPDMFISKIVIAATT